MKIILTLFLIVYFFAGCSNHVLQKSEIQKSKRTYQNISKDHFLHAAKKVFLLSNKEEFFIDSYRDELNVSRPMGVYNITSMNLEVDDYYIKVNEELNNTIVAQLQISKRYDHEGKDKVYLDKNSDIYALFWNRVEYLLGLKNRWDACSSLQVNDNNFLCESIYFPTQEVSSQDKIDLNSTKLKIINRINNEETVKYKFDKVNEMNTSEDKYISKLKEMEVNKGKELVDKSSNDETVPPEDNEIVIIQNKSYELLENNIIEVE